MKTKKLVSLFLAVAMIFAVLTVSVSADLYDVITNGAYTESCDGIGYFVFTDSNRTATAITRVDNTSDFEVRIKEILNI